MHRGEARRGAAPDKELDGGPANSEYSPP